jgi:hypothetical protein
LPDLVWKTNRIVHQMDNIAFKRYSQYIALVRFKYRI